jgi:hypothetical protein
MTDHRDQAGCADFQERLADLIGSGEDLSAHPHLQTCDRCRALLADLETIAAAARQLFPSVEPPDDLWQQIEIAIEEDQSE